MRIPKSSLDEIIIHARESYPKKCCGLLIGSHEPQLVVHHSFRATNNNHSQADDVHGIDPMELHQINKTTWGKNEEIVGFYHSHTDQPPLPSETDSARAWAAFCYLIVAVDGNGKAEYRAWVRQSADADWTEEAVEIG